MKAEFMDENPTRIFGAGLGDEMKVFVDGRDRGPLTPYQWKEVLKFLPDIEASGQVMNTKEAIQARWRLAWLQGAVCSAIVVGSGFIAIVISGDRTTGIYMLGIVAAAVAIIYAVCLTLVPLWKIGLAGRYVGLPEAGVLIRVDKSGLTIGDVVAPWEELSLQALYLADDDGDSLLKRLTLADAFDGVTLDPVLIENGKDIVGYIFRRICSEPPKEKT